jgi:hypothetical protein
MFSKITDTELYFIFHILYFILYILYSNSEKVLELEKKKGRLCQQLPPTPRKINSTIKQLHHKKINSTIVITQPQTHLIR